MTRHQSAALSAAPWIASLVLGLVLAVAGCSSSGAQTWTRADPSDLGPGRCGRLDRSAQSLQAVRTEMLTALNAVRARDGLTLWSGNGLLDQAAQTHALDMARRQTMSHTGGDGSSVADRVLRTGYEYRVVYENVAYGQLTVEDTVRSWMNSPPHRRAILSGDSAEMGLGFAIGDHETVGRNRLRPSCAWVLVMGTQLAP